MSTHALYDMHCHLDFMSNAVEVAHDAERAGLAIFATTVTPRGYKRCTKELLGQRNVRVGVGLHPWWVADGRVGPDDIDDAASLAFESYYVGEIGMDFSPAHAPESSFARQFSAFEKLAYTCAEGAQEYGAKVLSIHSVRSASSVLDVLERTSCLDSCRCIFHWFSGTGDELHRAVKSGCWFSVNEMMLSTKRGREYARQVPEGKLLLETDLPPHEGEPFACSEIVESLERTLSKLETIRGKDVREVVALNSRMLLG